MPANILAPQNWVPDPDEVVIGIDEAGRGAWAGPIVVAAVELRASDYAWASELRDSKKIPAARRRAILHQMLTGPHFGYEIGEVDNRVIDAKGIDVATAYACIWALTRMWVPSMRNTPVVLDGQPSNWHPAVHDWMKAHVKNWYFIPKSEDYVWSVAAASILAKTHRDAVMEEAADDDVNCWGFMENKGYGTETHRKALYANTNPSPLHRMTFEPMRSIWNG